MKLNVVQNLYKRNPFVPETVQLNLMALNATNIDYEYILFNDHGDKEIEEDIKQYTTDKRVKYIYSDINYGKGKCSGGWVGSIPHLTGDLIHNTGQDDVFTSAFYEKCIKELNANDELMFVFTNVFVTNENLVAHSLMLNPTMTPNYNNPYEVFKWWFGVGENGKNEVTRANNNIPAPGVIYRTKLHGLIGPPDLDNFLGAADFEFWARILFFGYKGKFINEPLWLYRKSDYSLSNQNDNISTPQWVEKIKIKYSNLYKEKQQ